MIGSTNTRRKGFNNTNAILIVSVPTGSTVTAIKNGTTLIPKMWVQNADNTLDSALFSIPSNTFDTTAWIVTATSGEYISVGTVVINGAYEYNIALNYRLPFGYQEVTYIESSGTQWIDTGIYPTQNTSAKIKFMNLATTGDCIFGQTGQWRFFNYNSACYFDLKNNVRISGSSININTLYELELGNFYVKDLTTGNNKISGTTKTFTPDASQTIKLNGNVSPSSKNKWYYAQIYNTGSLVCDLIPCYRISDSVAGMWDSVSKTFLTNQGSGSFIVGADTQPSDFNGTDAILIVTAPTGSTITATKNEIILTPTVWVQNTDNTLDSAIFSIPSSTFDTDAWTVTATLSGEIYSDTIIINASAEYNMEVYYTVPKAYQAVEYLQSSGTQYILTSIPANTVNSGTIDFMSTSLLQWAYIYGASSTGTSADPGGLGFSTAFGDSTPYKYGWVYDSQYNSTSSISVNADTNVRHTAEFHYLSNNIEYMFDDKIMTKSYTAETYTITTKPITLFALNNNGTVYDSLRVSARVYSFKLYNSNGDIILDCRPCYRKSDSVAGMWDRVSKTFLTNAGSGTFTVGADV